MKEVYIVVRNSDYYSSGAKPLIACESKEDAAQVSKSLGYYDEEKPESSIIALPLITCAKAAMREVASHEGR